MSRRTPAIAIVAVALGLAGWVVVPHAQGPSPRTPLHVAFTSEMFADVNINDAKAAIGVWADTIASAQRLGIHASTEVFDDLDSLGRAMDDGRAHLVAMSVTQYRRLNRPRFGGIMIAGRRGRFPEEFLLLVKRQAPRDLASLKGRRLVTVSGISHDIGLAWLDLALLDAGLGSASSHFAAVTSVPRPARAVLPVFFGQQDACLISRYGYELMAELNPQLERDLTAVLVSPPLAHAVLLLDTRFAPAIRADLVRALVSLHETPRGQQVMSMFGLERIAEGAEADLSASLSLLARLDRARTEAKRR